MSLILCKVWSALCANDTVIALQHDSFYRKPKPHMTAQLQASVLCSHAGGRQQPQGEGHSPSSILHWPLHGVLAAQHQHHPRSVCGRGAALSDCGHGQVSAQATACCRIAFRQPLQRASQCRSMSMLACKSVRASYSAECYSVESTLQVLC